MIYTLFFSRLRADAPEELAEYPAHAAALLAHAQGRHPGFVDIKTFTAEDGERLTVARFRDMESQKAWSTDSMHGAAKRKGRSSYYSQYRIVVCDEQWERSWQRTADGSA